MANLTEAQEWLVLDEVDSTQRVAADLLLSDSSVRFVFAHHQSRGRGRFDRVWLSSRGASLTLSILFRDHADHPAPWLVGMACAVAASGCCGCKVRWPNDLTIGGLKVGGILTEMLSDPSGRRVPVVGIGINLSGAPSGMDATDLAAQCVCTTPLDLAHAIVGALPTRLPTSWDELQESWMEVDDTPGKRYRSGDGVEGVAIGIGAGGCLILDVDGVARTVLAADAVPGVASSSQIVSG